MVDNGFSMTNSSTTGNFNIIGSQIPIVLSISLREDFILISAKPQLSNNLYNRSFSLEELSEAHPSLAVLESLERIYNSLIEKAGESKIILDEESDPLNLIFLSPDDYMESKITLSLGKISSTLNATVGCCCDLTEINDKLTAFSDAINVSEVRVNSIDDRVRESEEKTASMDSKIQDSDAKVALLEEKLNELELKNSQLEENVRLAGEISPEMKSTLETSESKFAALDERLKFLEEKNSNLEEKLVLSESKICHLEETVRRLESEFDKSIENSKIISKEEIEILKKWIGEGGSSNVNFKLLFRSSVHGRTGRDFHRKCDNRGHTITIIKATNGTKFGGYTTLLWEPSSGTWKGNDPNAFIFSLDKNLKLKCNDQDYVIHTNSDYGPIFGAGFDIMVHPQFSDNCSSNTPHSYGKNEGVDRYCLTNGAEFVPEEIEVYQII